MIQSLGHKEISKPYYSELFEYKHTPTQKTAARNLSLGHSRCGSTERVVVNVPASVSRAAGVFWNFSTAWQKTQQKHGTTSRTLN